MQLEIKFFQVGCGDAICIRFMDSCGAYQNIFIDGGYKKSYLRTIKQEIKSEIQPKDERINLWVLTHIDRDHINGIVSFLEDHSFNHKDIVQKIWFNFSSNQPTISSNSEKIGFTEGISLRDKILELGIPSMENISTDLGCIKVGDAQITILSPNQLGLSELKSKWNDYEKSQYNSFISSKSDDYSKTIFELSQLEDTIEKRDDVSNRSSIAFLFEYHEKKILFLGDAHPSIIIESLKKLRKLNGSKLIVDYVKLSHHGSKHNFSKKLLDYIECYNFIISTNGGGTYNLPNKEVLSKILTHERDCNKQITFIFNHNNPTLKRIFAVDGDSCKNYNFKCEYPSTEQNASIIQFN
jgi:beta-lactamase superfamily II metal-dependent hydrolase